MQEEGFRIQKSSVPISCHTARDDRIQGEIFVDLRTAEGYSTKQVLDFFNSAVPFFPIKTRDHERPILLAKRSVVKVEIAGALERFEAEASTPFIIKKEAVLHMRSLGPVRATLVVDLPAEHSRLLDLLSLPLSFYAAIIHGTFCLINARHIYKIEEL